MIHHVFANRSNVGDWLSARGIQRLLRAREVREYLCDDPFVEETLAALSRVPSADLIVVGGGGLLMDYFDPLWSGLREIARRSSVCLWGIGCCDIKENPSHPSRPAVIDVVRNARLCVVRDALTREYLSLPLPDPVPCPSLAVIPAADAASGLLHVDNYTTAGADVYNAMDTMCRAFARRTGRVYRQTNNRIEAGREAELERVLSIYRRSDLVVSSALHGCVIAVAMGRPVVAVCGDRKIEAFMQMAGLGEWVLDTCEVGLLPERLAALPRQAPTWDFLARARAQNEQVAQQIRQFAAEADLVRSGCGA